MAGISDPTAWPFAIPGRPTPAVCRLVASFRVGEPQARFRGQGAEGQRTAVREKQGETGDGLTADHPGDRTGAGFARAWDKRFERR